MPGVNSQPLILHVLSGDLWGGAEAQMERQIKAQRELGIDSRALLFNSAETAKRYQAARIPSYELLESKGLLKLLSECGTLVASLAPDGVVTHGFKENILFGLLSIRFRFALYSMFHGSSESYRGLKRLKTACYSVVHLAVSRYLAQTPITVTRALATELKVEAKVIHNVAEIDPEQLGELPFDAAYPVIVCVGRLVRVKRLDRAIAAMSGLSSESQAILYLIGEGPEQESLEALTAELGLAKKIKFLGFRTDASSLISRADLLLLTSESEGLPTVVLEAMLSGVPIVATDLPGLREIKDKFPNYPLYLVGNPSEYPDKIRQGLKQKKVGRDNEIVEYLSPKRAARQFKEIIT